MHTLFALSFGLSQKKIVAVLDNSPLKIGKYLYKYKLPCKSFKEIVEDPTPKLFLLTGGCYTKEVLQNVKANPHIVLQEI